MGMDVIGTAPTGGAGRSFSRSVWYWHPLADLVCALAPEITSACTEWHTNDGDGLNAKESQQLSAILKRAVADGTAAHMIKEREETNATLPDERCGICKGTGIRCDEIGVKAGQPEMIVSQTNGAGPDHPRLGQKGWCNGCSGRGFTRPFETWYRLELADVEEFAEFLAWCGGFSIC